MIKLHSGFARKLVKNYKPDPKTGKWRGRETKNGKFVTIKPGWSDTFTVGDKEYTLEVWAFDTRWGLQSLFYEIKYKTEEREDDGF